MKGHDNGVRARTWSVGRLRYKGQKEEPSRDGKGEEKGAEKRDEDRGEAEGSGGELRRLIRQLGHMGR